MSKKSGDGSKVDATELTEGDLEKAQGGITLDNGIKQHGVIVRKDPDSLNSGMPPAATKT